MQSLCWLFEPKTESEIGCLIAAMQRMRLIVNSHVGYVLKL